MIKQIKVGDVVKVIDSGKQYTSYAVWASRHSLRNFKDGASLAGTEGVVEVIATHGGFSEDTTVLCGINVNGQGHIIDIQGLEFVRENKPFDLQLFQRVELRNGEKGIVVTNTQEYNGDRNAITTSDGWVATLFPGEGETVHAKKWEITKVFDLPHFNSDMLDINARGKLLWKETIPVASEVIAADLAITEAENSVKAAQVALEAAKAARQAL